MGLAHDQTWNSCVDPCPASECGSAYAARLNPVVGNGPLDYCASPAVPNGVVPEIFKNCADIKIVPAAGTPVSVCGALPGVFPVCPWCAPNC